MAGKRKRYSAEFKAKVALEAIKGEVNQTVRLPRWRRTVSYSAQFVTRCRCLGMWCRRAAWALNGTAGIRGSWKRPLPYAIRSPEASHTDPCNRVHER